MVVASSSTTTPQPIEVLRRVRELGAGELHLSVKITQKFASTQELTGTKQLSARNARWRRWS